MLPPSMVTDEHSGPLGGPGWTRTHPCSETADIVHARLWTLRSVVKSAQIILTICMNH